MPFSAFTGEEAIRMLRARQTAESTRAATTPGAAAGGAALQQGHSVGQAAPVNGTWDDDGVWGGFFTFDVGPGFDDGGLG